MAFMWLQTTGDPTASLNELGELSLADWLWAIGIIVVAGVAAMLVRRLTLKTLEPSVAPFVARLLARLVALVAFGLGFVYALDRVGVSIAPILGLLGLFGLAIAFAFQEVLENFIAGVFLSVRRPFSEGDEITTDDYEGVVEDVSLRAVTMKTYDGQRVYIPNASVWRNPIVNHTELDSRRTTLVVGVGYDTDLQEAGTLLEETLRSVEGVHLDPAPQAYAHEFADSSINYALRFWHDSTIASVWKVRDGVTKAVKRALDDANIEIPFPQRVIWSADSDQE